MEVNRFSRRCRFPVNFSFEVLISSLQEKTQNIERGISFKHKFEFQIRVNSISLMQDLCGGDFCVIEIDPNIVDIAGVENNMITLYNAFNDQICKMQKYFCKQN